MLACALLPVAAPADAHSGVSIEARVDAPAIDETNRRLVGVGWDGSAFTARVAAPLRPDLVRIDASMENLYHRGPRIDDAVRATLLGDVQEARSIGATPVVILSYMPRWLADGGRPTTDVTRVPPSDPAVWKRLVIEVVTMLSAAGVKWFEVWNEPDFPVFFQGLPTEFFESIYRPSAEAVGEVARRTGRRLRFGGCACSTPNPVWIAEMIRFAQDNGLPLDFISWHYYGNTPFLGPDGAEPIGPPEVRPLLAPLRQRNPATSFAFYGDQVELVRYLRDALYEGDAKPELWIDEWNLSPGGFDRRHDTAEGAAFQAGVLIELQRRGLDRAAVFRSVDPAYGTDVVPRRPELFGAWGLVGRYGTVKPAWRAHRFWRDLGRDVLAYASPGDARLGVTGVLTRRGRRTFAAILSNYVAQGGHAHRAELRLLGAGTRIWSVTVRRLDGAIVRSTIASRGTLVVPVDLAPQSAVLVEVRTS